MINAAFLRGNRSALIAEEGGVSPQEEGAWHLKYLKVLFMVLNSYPMPDTVLNTQHTLSHFILEQPYEVGTVNSLILQWKNWGTETLRDFLSHRAAKWKRLSFSPASYLQPILKFCGFHLFNFFQIKLFSSFPLPLDWLWPPS